MENKEQEILPMQRFISEENLKDHHAGFVDSTPDNSVGARRGPAGDPREEVTALLRSVYVDQDVTLFLSHPQPLLAGEVPNDMIASGREREVVEVFRAFVEGAHS
jgi:hypothetical protein